MVDLYVKVSCLGLRKKVADYLMVILAISPCKLFISFAYYLKRCLSFLIEDYDSFLSIVQKCHLVAALCFRERHRERRTLHPSLGSKMMSNLSY